MTEEQTLEEFFEEAPVEDEEKLVSRRRFLAGAAAGGAAGLAVAAGTGAAVWKVYDAELLAAKEAAEAKLESTKKTAEAEREALQDAHNLELARVLGLMELYEELEKVGLDKILEVGMSALALPMAAVEAGAKALKAGLDWAEDALQAVVGAVPSAHEGLVWLKTQVSAVADAVEKLEAGIGKALDKMTDNPVGEALEDFTNKVLDSLPFGLGDKFRDALEGLVGLVTSVDELIEGINTYLLEPLEDEWFSEEDGKGVGGTFLDPLVENVFDPLQAHLENLAVLADDWQDKLVEPSRVALTERAEIREQIAQYKKEYGLS
jgi:chorismate mutase